MNLEEFRLTRLEVSVSNLLSEFDSFIKSLLAKPLSKRGYARGWREGGVVGGSFKLTV